ncbi:MAG: sigma-70 family RNA polymerase sigma factor [Myxococcales bacterium]|nr:sigma-70 family RNA polymerase sigma factor [Myxococcales bacterium]
MSTGGERGERQRLTRELFDKHSALIYSKCLRMLGNREDAADAVQETFTKAFRALEQAREVESQLAWLFRIATTTCLNMIRTRERKGAVLLDEVSSVVAHGQQHPLDAMQRQRVFDALSAQCDERTLEIFVAHFVDGMDQGQIAAQLGISRRAVVKRLTRLRELAKAIYRSEVGEP